MRRIGRATGLRRGLARQLREREANRVGAVLFHQVERVNDVALRLAHLLALRVAHQRRDIKRP